ncbi:MAG: CPBP family intramembrane glutamic endopeptidase [Elusimicrobiota bacterium]
MLTKILKTNYLYIILTFIVIYSIGFFSVISVKTPGQQIKEISESVSEQSEESTDLKEVISDAEYMKKIEEKLVGNFKFRVISKLMFVVLILILLLGLVFAFFGLIFRFLKIQVFNIKRIKLSYYLKFDFLDLAKFIIVYSCFYFLLKHIVFAELILIDILQVDPEKFMGINIYLSMMIMNILPCMFLILYMKRKYNQGVHFMGVHKKDVMKNLGFGIISYITAYPLLFIALVITFIVVQYVGAYIPPHPIVPMMIEDESKVNILSLIIFSCIVGPVTEEIFFRGMIYPFLRKRSGIVLAAILSSLCFALMHFNIIIAPIIFITGLLFVYLYEKSGSLAPGIFIHILHNTVMVSWVLVIKAIV